MHQQSDSPFAPFAILQMFYDQNCLNALAVEHPMLQKDDYHAHNAANEKILAIATQKTTNMLTHF
jgi:hypothetical protein